MIWREIENGQEFADGMTAIVFQPAVEYAGGSRFSAYITEATYCGDGYWYSETYNAKLQPTHWMQMPEPPEGGVVVKSPAKGPRMPLWDVSSTA